MEGFRALLTDIRATLGFLPDWIVALAILAVAVAIALGLHAAAHAIVRRLLREDRPYLRRLESGTRGPIRLALILLALGVALPVAPLDPAVAHLLARLSLVATIVLVGWIAMTAIHMASDLYLQRFRIDVADNLLARKHVTQVRVLMRAIDILVVIVTLGAALMTFESVRQYGVSLFASAGIAGLVAGLAARPVLSNLIAGVQLAMTQPIRLEDAVIVENEFGHIEEITATYVVVRLWDWRRLIVPLTYFSEKPFQNWTREQSAVIGSVLLYLDYRAPIEAIRAKAEDIAKQSSLWDHRVFALQVTDAKERTIEVRVLVSANSAGQAFDLRCDMREQLIAFLQRHHPEALPRERQEMLAIAPLAIASNAAETREPRKRSA